MAPYFTFNPQLKSYMFMPESQIFDPYPPLIKQIVATTFYEIFDGYYNVTLQFNLKIKKLKGLDPWYFKFLMQKNNNT
jgi:hypothetical protein